VWSRPFTVPCAAGTVIGPGLPPRFQAEAVLIIHSRPQRISDIPEVLPDPVPDIPVIRSKSIRSNPVGDRAGRALTGIGGYRNFRSRVPGGWSWQTLQARLGAIWYGPRVPVSSVSQALSQMIPTPAAGQIDETIEKYARRLFVQTDGTL
jgi:hypothetical protein